MARIIQLHLWMHNKSGTWTEPEVINPRSGKPQPGKRIVLEPESDSLTGMKIQIAKTLMHWRRTGQLKSYYVVAVAQRDEGEVSYRTIIPLTVVID